MSYKKTIVTIMTLVVLLLLTMSTTIQAASIGKVYNLTADFDGKSIIIRWDSVSGAAGYAIYADGKYIGAINNNEAALIGFKENTTYKIKVQAYTYQNGERIYGTASSEISTNTKVNETLGRVSDLEISQNNGIVTLNWPSVSKANKYQIFATIPNFGDVNIGEVSTCGAMIRGFQDGQKYSFKVRACQVLSSGNLNYGDYSVTRTVTINSDVIDDGDDNITRPNQVTGVSISNVTESTVNISWNKATNAEKYEVLVSEDYDSNYYNYYNTSSTSVKLSGLAEGTYYRVKIVAYRTVNGKKIYGDESSYKTFTTKENNVTIGKVNNVTVNNITENKATLSWSKATNATRYNVYVSENYGDFRYYTSTSSTSYTLSDLYSNTSYRVKVEGYTTVNGKEFTGDCSNIKSFTTDDYEYNNVPAKVSNLKVSNITKNKATLSWSKATNATGYNIYVSEDGGRFNYYASTSSTSYTLSNLYSSTDYEIRVEGYRTVNGKEITGDWSNVQRFTTLSNSGSSSGTSKPARVTHLSASVEHRNEAYLSWWPVDGADGYVIYSSRNNGTYEWKADIQGDNNFILKDLDYNTSYKVKVKSYVWDRNGNKVYCDSYSDTVSFKTEKSSTTENSTKVDKVTGIRYPVTGDTVKLSWNAVYGAAGYEIEFTVPGLGGFTKFITTTNSRTISGLTDKVYNYTARIRAYRVINGITYYGEYSDMVKFTGR